MTRLYEAVATVFGIGRVSMAPGTVASAVALVCAWPITTYGGQFLLLLFGLAALSAGAWACELYVRGTGLIDPSECVIDEVAGQWIACAFAPRTLIGFLAAFALFRFFDIAKPWPISRLERLHGGIGIMADDLGAALAAALILALLVRASLL